MQETNRKNAKGEKDIGNDSKANEKKTDKEKIKELAKKKREMQPKEKLSAYLFFSCCSDC